MIVFYNSILYHLAKVGMKVFSAEYIYFSNGSSCCDIWLPSTFYVGMRL